MDGIGRVEETEGNAPLRERVGGRRRELVLVLLLLLLLVVVVVVVLLLLLLLLKCQHPLGPAANGGVGNGRVESEKVEERQHYTVVAGAAHIRGRNTAPTRRNKTGDKKETRRENHGAERAPGETVYISSSFMAQLYLSPSRSSLMSLPSTSS
jgi:hypothetical protein